jgi:hypothetical protein
MSYQGSVLHRGSRSGLSDTQATSVSVGDEVGSRFAKPSLVKLMSEAPPVVVGRAFHGVGEHEA